MIKRISGLLLLLSICSVTATAQFLYDYTTIQRIEIFFDQPNWDYQMDTAKIGTDTFIVASMVLINGTQFDSVGVKYKGNSSYDSTYVKNPLHISLDEFKNQSYAGFTNIKLGNGYADPSMIREVLSYNVLRNYMDCPQSGFAEVFINGVYIGLYSNVESIDKKFLSAKFHSTQNTFIKCNPIGNPGPTTKCNLRYINSDSTSYQNYYELKSDFGWNELVDLCDTVTNTPSSLTSIIDIDRVAWMLAFNNVLINLDSYNGVFCQNYYLYRDNDGLFNPVVWDLNMSLGGFPFSGGGATGMGSLTVAAMGQFPLNAHSTDPYWPLINDIFNNAQFKRMYFAHARTITNEFFVTNGYSTNANYLHGIINPSVAADTNKFFTDAQYQNSLTTDIAVGSYTVPGINNLCSARSLYILGTTEYNYILPAISNIVVSDTFPNIGSTIYITATIANAGLGVYLGYRYDNDLHFSRIPMVDDGAHGDGSAGDGVYGVSVSMDAAQLYYYIYAENADAGIFSPERAEHEFYHVTANVPVATNGQVVINEFLAVNQADTINENGKNEDWIELYNTTNNDLSLFGLYITDDYTNPTKFAFPENTIIQANGYLIIWADEKNTTSYYIHTNFKLAGTGEELMLSDLNGNVLDSLTFGPQTTDISMGRCPNGTGNFQTLPATTFAKENCPVGIEEISSYTGKIEIYPNPACNQLTIRFTKSDSSNLFTIYDATGRVQYTSKAQEEISINISDWPSGVYFVRSGSVVSRFAIQ